MKRLFLVLGAALAATPMLATAQVTWVPGPTAIPSLDDVGLIALAVTVGGLGAWLISRKK